MLVKLVLFDEGFAMRYSHRLLFSIFIGVPVSGCASNYIPPPTTITLQDALVDSVRAYKAAQRAGLGDVRLLPCALEIKFNVTGSASDTDKLGLTAGPAAGVIPASLALSGSVEQSISGGRQNTVTATFVTPYDECKSAPKKEDK
jgi:hypothetical protein